MSEQLPPEYFPPVVARMMRFYGCGESRSSVRATLLQVCPKCYQGPEDHKEMSDQPKHFHSDTCCYNQGYIQGSKDSSWNLRDGLLPALRAVLAATVGVLSTRDEFAHLECPALLQWTQDRIDDAALLELAGVKGGDANSGRHNDPPDMTEAGAGRDAPSETGAGSETPSADGVPENTGSAPASSLPPRTRFRCTATFEAVDEIEDDLCYLCGEGPWSHPREQAAEPTERTDYDRFRAASPEHAALLIDEERKLAASIALLEAARDLREMKGTGYYERENAIIEMCADRLEARAKEISG